MEDPSVKMNLGDPELELIDPTPNVYVLFTNFDRIFFWSKLLGRAVVKWSKRMYSCAGVCAYEGRGGLCVISLSEPLLKLRPRKDLVETLLHEMIHAYLFITNQDRDRDGHGPNFQEHMYRINKMAGVNITIYHDFHDEVNLYLTHWWRCNGPCQTRRPYFGVVRRTCNRPPGPCDYWWKSHKKNCGGTFIKIKEPEKAKKTKSSKTISKPSYPDITTYMTNKTTQTTDTISTPLINKKPQPGLNNNQNIVNKNITQTDKTPTKILKDTSNTLPNNNLQNKYYVTKIKIFVKGNLNNPPVINQNVNALIPPNVMNNTQIFDYNGNISMGRQRTQSANVVETVRNVWANKQIPNASNTKVDASNEKNPNPRKSVDTINPNKNKYEKMFSDDSPPHKIKKMETDEDLAMSVLKDVYGKDFKVSRTDNKLVATSAIKVDCPICKIKVEENNINAHLDECLNADVIKKMFKDHLSDKKHATNSTDTPLVVPGNSIDKSKNKKGPMVKSNTIPDFNGNHTKHPVNIKAEKDCDSIDLPYVSIEKQPRNTADKIPSKHVTFYNTMPSTSKVNAFDPQDGAKIKKTTKILNYDKHQQKTNHVEPEKDINDIRYLPSCIDDMATKITLLAKKIETGDDIANIKHSKCPCCDKIINRSIDEHLDECLAFFDNNATVPEEGASTSFASEPITIEDDDDLDETQTHNATGTKNPCPCCMKMVEGVDMNNHLDQCLAS